MRHIRTRRRFKLILSILCILSFLLLIENKIEAFVPHAKNFAVLKIEEALGGRVKLSIGSIDGGILYPVSLDDIRIMDKKNAPLFPSVTINGIKTNYRIWDIVFKKKDDGIALSSILGDSYIDMSFITNNREVSGFVRFNRVSETLRVSGILNILKKYKVEFKGMLKDDSFDIELKLKNGVINLEGIVSETGELVTNFKITHLKVYGFDIVCDGTLKHAIVMTGDPRTNYIEGRVDTNNLVINYKPFLDLHGSYKIINGVLNLEEMSFSDTIKSRGTIALKKPFEIDLSIVVNNVSLVWLMTSLGAKEGDAAVSGTMNGKFEIKGTLDRLRSNSHLEIRKGMLSTLDFDYLMTNLKGDGPIIRIEDSRITRQSGYFVLAGEMDLRRIGKDIFFNNIKITSDEKAITWDDWDVSKLQGADEVRMKKKLSEDINLDFKKFESTHKVDESMAYKDEVQVEYKLHPNESLKMMLGKDKDFLGFEHKDRF